MADTRETRDLPVLKVIVDAFEENPNGNVRLGQLQEMTGFSREELGRALAALDRAKPPYFRGTRVAGLSYPIIITEITERAMTTIEEWGSLKKSPNVVNLVVLTDEQLLRTMEPLLGKIRAVIETDTTLDPDTEANLRADLDSANDQAKAPTPNRSVIKASLDRILTVLPAINMLVDFVKEVNDLLRGLGL